MMRKINKRFVGGMWVPVPWDRDLGDMEIVIVSPDRGSAASPLRSPSCSPSALQLSRYLYGCSKDSKVFIYYLLNSHSESMPSG